MNELFESDDTNESLESKLRLLEPRAPIIDWGSVQVQQQNAPPGAAAPAGPDRRVGLSGWVLAGTWVSGVLAGCLLMMLLRGTTPTNSQKIEPVDGAYDLAMTKPTRVAQPSAASPPTMPGATTAAATMDARSENVFTIANAQPVRLNSASHLGLQLKVQTPPHNLSAVNRPVAPKPIQDASQPKSRRQLMKDLLSDPIYEQIN